VNGEGAAGGRRQAAGTAKAVRTGYWLLVIGNCLAGVPLAGQTPLARRWDNVQLRHDALRYDISLTLPDSGAFISAEVTTRWKLGAGSPIRVDLDDALTVRTVTVNGAAARWKRIGDRIEIPVTGRTGADVTTRIRYDGTPIDGLLLRGAGPNRTVFADNWPDRAHLWLASQDHPADKAVVSWTIDAPAGFTVVANGVLQSVDSAADGRRVRWRYFNAEPIPVYTMVLGMARFAVTTQAAACAVRCVPVSVFTYPDDSAFALTGPFRRANQIVDFFAQRFAPFPYAELRHLESSTRFGGMENSTAIFYDEKAYRSRTTREEVVAHETAHQWFGDAVTEADWHHIWLSEGFATYGAALWQEHLGGDSALHLTMQEAKDRIVASAATEQPILDSTITNRFALLNSNSYEKGSWVLHSLRGLIGDQAFFRGLTQYYQKYQHRNTLSSDFAREMGVAAHQDLSWFFRQALTQPGYPILEVKTELDGGHLQLTIRQVQKPAWGLYRLPNLRVRLDDRRLTVNLTGAVTRLATHWESDRLPTQVTVDPEGWWLLKSGER
jgi:aminopeptidase N